MKNASKASIIGASELTIGHTPKMKILFIPLDTSNLESNEHIPSRLRLLLRTNEVIGVRRTVPLSSEGIESLGGLIGLLHYAFKVTLFGLRQRKGFDLI